MRACLRWPPLSKAWPGSAGRTSVLRQLLLHALVESLHVDHDPLVQAVADEFTLVARLDAKGERAAVDLHELGAGGHAHPDRRGRNMAHVEMDPQRLVPRRKKLFAAGQRRSLEQVDHH